MTVDPEKHNCSEKFSPPSPAEPEKRRPGAPRGNRNALKHGRRTREMDEFRAEVRAHLRQTRALIAWARQLCRLRAQHEAALAREHMHANPVRTE